MGSPPREWGQPFFQRLDRAFVRFTPTRVGTAWSTAGWTNQTSVHPHASGDSATGRLPNVEITGSPHASGDSTVCECRLLVNKGSPPREWGQLVNPRLAPVNNRFTPTRVGTAPRQVQKRTRATVHPHASGDSSISFSPSNSIRGSPPREWGQPRRLTAGIITDGFTPTRVGTAPRQVQKRTRATVHPHASGDSGISFSPSNSIRGSPPREWGQPRRLTAGIITDGFTPTRMGTASRATSTPAIGAVHPHASGDSCQFAPKCLECPGSPPREWGQRIPRADRVGPHRFTPTRVGTAPGASKPTTC